MPKNNIEPHSATVVGERSRTEPYELPEGWNWTQAKDIADIYTGNSINEKVKAEKYTGKKNGLNFIGTKDVDFDGTINYENGVKITDFENFKTAPENTALLCIEGGSAGKKLGFTEEKVCFGNKLCAFVSKNIEPKLIYYYLQSNAFFYCFMKERHGLIGGVSVNTLKHLPFPLPPTLAEQQRIVSRIESLFTKLDEAKDKAQSVVDGFELRRAAVLHKAFTGELTAKWRKEHGVKDESWEEKTIGKCCEVTSSKRIYQSEQTQSGIPFLRVADIIRKIQGEQVSPELYISEEMYQNLKSQNLVPKENEILVTARGTLGKCYLVKDNDTFYFQDGMISWLKNIANQILSVYLVLLFQSKEITSQIDEKQNGSTVNYLSISMLKEITIPVPTLPEQQEIVRILDTVLEKETRAKEAAKTVLDKIALLKKSILARAFRGEL